MAELVYVPEIIDHTSPNRSLRKRGVRVDTVLIHHTASPSDELAERNAVNWLCNPMAKLSAHYVVGVRGVVYRLVDERLAAWHAGVAALPWEKGPWVVNGRITTEGYGWFNSRSIGIEVVNPGDGKTPFTEAQYRALEWLVPDICKRLALASVGMAREHGDGGVLLAPHGRGGRGYVLGHRDVAPGRKTDPADNFDWGRIRSALERSIDSH